MGVDFDVLLRATTSYFDVLEARQLVALETRNVALLRQELAGAQARFDVGEVTRTDISITEARVATAISQQAAAQGDLTLATEAFRLAVGRPPGIIDQVTADMQPDLAYPPRGRGLEQALRDHPAVLEATYRLAAADGSIALAQTALSPTTTLRGEFSFDQDTQPGGLLRLRSTGPIYSGGALASGVRRAYALRGEAAAILRIILQDVQRQVNFAYIDLDVAIAELNAARVQVDATNIAFDSIREEARLGSRMQLDVLDAAQELRVAETDLIIAQIDVMRARVGILHATGLLSADFLDLPVERYELGAASRAALQAPNATSPQGRALDRILQR
ncbi:TolC family protein [Phaeobacter inhibens]|uniref:TolC family protein n=1 Tax=Phaeobacter inhibens TaxID=221822 RepID=UPI0021A7B872|nr:TolC family protein [Phaeobacter inhibens]UWR47022.1 TolC family protein [Phaeobacter inhibens]